MLCGLRGSAATEGAWWRWSGDRGHSRSHIVPLSFVSFCIPSLPLASRGTGTGAAFRLSVTAQTMQACGLGEEQRAAIGPQTPLVFHLELKELGPFDVPPVLEQNQQAALMVQGGWIKNHWGDFFVVDDLQAKNQFL